MCLFAFLRLEFLPTSTTPVWVIAACDHVPYVVLPVNKLSAAWNAELRLLCKALHSC